MSPKREKDLTPEEQHDLERLLESSQEIKRVYQLLQSFLQMLRARQPERLNQALPLPAVGILHIGNRQPAIALNPRGEQKAPLATDIWHCTSCPARHASRFQRPVQRCVRSLAILSILSPMPKSG